MATLPGAWHYRVSTWTGRPSVSILWLGEVESLICNFYLSVAACKIASADPFLGYTNLLLGRWTTNKETNMYLQQTPSWRRASLQVHKHMASACLLSPSHFLIHMSNLWICCQSGTPSGQTIVHLVWQIFTWKILLLPYHRIFLHRAIRPLLMLTPEKSPWGNRTGWLGVKH